MSLRQGNALTLDTVRRVANQTKRRALREFGSTEILKLRRELSDEEFIDATQGCLRIASDDDDHTIAYDRLSDECVAWFSTYSFEGEFALLQSNIDDYWIVFSNKRDATAFKLIWW